MSTVIRLVDESSDDSNAATGRTLKAVYRASKEGTSIFPKAGEIVEMGFVFESLSLAARKALLMLMQNAGSDAGSAIDHVITKKELRRSHDSNDRLSDILEELISIKVKLKTTSKQLRPAILTSSLLEKYIEEVSEDGMSTVEYRFSEASRIAMAGSNYYAQIRIAVAMAFKSKYSLSLYELGSLYLHRRDSFWQGSIEELRARIGVAADKYKNFAIFRREVLTRAKAEIDQLADFEMTIDEIRGDGKGRPIKEIKLTFTAKDAAGINEAADELARPKVGREARRSDKVELIVDARNPAKILFPSGSLHYSADDSIKNIVVEHGGGWDRDVIAEAYRSHMGGKLVKLSGPALYKSFEGFCKSWVNTRGHAK